MIVMCHSKSALVKLKIVDKIYVQSVVHLFNIHAILAIYMLNVQ